MFLRGMGVKLGSVRWQYAIVYIDGFTIFSKTNKDILEHTEKILLLLINTGMTIKLKKCIFFGETTDYLQLVTALGQLQVAHKTTETVKMLQYHLWCQECVPLWAFVVYTVGSYLSLQE